MSTTSFPVPTDPLDTGLGEFRRRLADSATLPDDEVAELLTTGYALLLELEADHAAAARDIDEALEDDDPERVLVAVRRQRGLRAAGGALREELDALAAIRRPRPGAGPPPPGR